MRGIKILPALWIITTCLYSQNKEINDLVEGELKMTFPSVYFKNNSTEYAEMPQKADSILHFIASHKKEIKSYVIWRDSTETEDLTKKRIDKLKHSLAKYKAEKINIQSMGNKQKISRYTINKAEGFEQNQYLLSLNSVFEVARTRTPDKITTKRRKIFDLPCWLNPQLDRSGREHCKAEKRMLRQREKETNISQKKNTGTKEKKHLPRLVWCGWRYGFHWDTPGNTKKVKTERLSADDKSLKNNHIYHPRIWCISCWRNHRFTKEYRQLHVRSK
ncbi:MAG: hypothetical protein ACXVPN_05160 [Bacteroidia bacterium]